MEYTITSTKYMGDVSKEFIERFEGTPQEIAELLRLTNEMGEEVDEDEVQKETSCD